VELKKNNKLTSSELRKIIGGDEPPIIPSPVPEPTKK